eukprot:TRINITY_DN72080_c0_g1_i1.p1 TRINITY_DN72080_c0_g1~~TRINITY_DN72080_c0_g1_i1.p1  ORF type:complete len:143 (+),score=12.10 TRINITY_DN72080_c0_g1_i1:23-430(+)
MIVLCTGLLTTVLYHHWGSHWEPSHGICSWWFRFLFARTTNRLESTAIAFAPFLLISGLLFIELRVTMTDWPLLVVCSPIFLFFVTLLAPLSRWNRVNGNRFELLDTGRYDDFVGQIGRAVQQECRDRSRMPSSA